MTKGGNIKNLDSEYFTREGKFTKDGKLKLFSTLKLVKSLQKLKPTKINPQDYKYLLKHKAWNNGTLSPNQVLKSKTKYKKEWQRINKANLKYPIILAKQKLKNNQEFVSLINGYHRLVKAIVNKVKTVPANIISFKQLDTIIKTF